MILRKVAGEERRGNTGAQLGGMTRHTRGTAFVRGGQNRGSVQSTLLTSTRSRVYLIRQKSHRTLNL